MTAKPKSLSFSLPSVIVILLVLIPTALSFYLKDHGTPSALFSMAFKNPIIPGVYGACLSIYLIHFLLLRSSRTMTTRSARKWGLILLGFIPAVLILIVGTLFNSFNNRDHMEIPMMFAPFLFLFWASGFIVYSLPCSFFSSLPLLLNYLIIALLLTNPQVSPFIVIWAYVPLAGYLFPTHRRLIEFWRPKRLPKLQPYRGGFTLIELLIVVAILAILTVSIGTVSSTAHRTLERQEDWRRAVALTQDQIALLRAKDALPEPGKYPIDQELSQAAQNAPVARQGEVEIRPGPNASLREVRVNVRLRGGGMDRDVSLGALLPVKSPLEASR